MHGPALRPMPVDRLKRTRVSSDLVSLSPIAELAQQSQIPGRIRAALRPRDHVVELQAFLAAAFHAATLIAAPHLVSNALGYASPSPLALRIRVEFRLLGGLERFEFRELPPPPLGDAAPCDVVPRSRGQFATAPSTVEAALGALVSPFHRLGLPGLDLRRLRRERTLQGYRCTRPRCVQPIESGRGTAKRSPDPSHTRAPAPSTRLVERL